jgi:hypothetical protein
MAIIDGQLIINEEVLDLSIVEEPVNLTLTEEAANVAVEESVIYFVSEAEQGPQGPPGVVEEDMMYSKRIDFISDNLLYRGEAAVGSLTSAESWRIRKIEVGVDGDITETWANGSASFSQIWDNRSLLTYS